ncbi:hypothetical protein TD95_001405 [Thielaviopsis punctulata]|uniref:Carboxypeptidase n=1 Tax=Thielaviopsis punctulata TaxID=72032 RepID=A0A0F4Z8H7_9PEZI|nr:hypothetical protein TD95_001405 [Thielaviopsis punctulata]
MVRRDSLFGLSVQTLMLSLMTPTVLAQFPSRNIPGLNTTMSPLDSTISVKYKAPENACKTAFDSQEQLTGYITIPATSADPEQNIFFWFVGAREPTEALTLWFAGGPGQSSITNFFTGQGACSVVEKGMGNLETVVNEWGWDRASNMLFIDQPIRTGFSYDSLNDGFLNLTSQAYILTEVSSADTNLPPILRPNGTFPSVTSTITTTRQAAAVVWKSLQGFFGVFPEFLPNCTSKALGINLFAESYGGKYAPVFADYFHEQNVKREDNTLSQAATLPIHLHSVGIINGCVDSLIQTPYYPSQAYENVYGLQLISEAKYNELKADWASGAGCRDYLEACYAEYSTLDPNLPVLNVTITETCVLATALCSNTYSSWFESLGRDPLDLTHVMPNSYTSFQFMQYLNLPHVQQALGVSVNWTDQNQYVLSNYLYSGDWAFGPIAPLVADLLNRGVRVGFLYGDRDFTCNWLGGEAVSLAIASEAGGDYATEFPSAGYAPIYVNESYVGGVVRQYGNLSFSRIYQAGHHVAVYQPETAFQVFARIITGADVSTGQPVDLSSFATKGPSEASKKLPVEPQGGHTCYLRQLPQTCSVEDYTAILLGEGMVISNVWYANESDWSPSIVTEPTSLTGVDELS